MGQKQQKVIGQLMPRSDKTIECGKCHAQMHMHIYVVADIYAIAVGNRWTLDTNTNSWLCNVCNGRPKRGGFTIKMMPGQEPYTTKELGKLFSLVHQAAKGDPGELDEWQKGSK